MAILVTGASGFVGRALIEKLLLYREYRIYALSRHPPEAQDRVVPIKGDITDENLGLKEVPEDIAAVYHVAGIHSLGKDRDGSIWRTNVQGTENVLAFCLRHKIRQLLFTSTAYSWPCNTYGLSKLRCESLIGEAVHYGYLKARIFKPSIIMGTAKHPYPGHFSQFVRILVKVHLGAETVRRTVEEALALPRIEPVFRVQGNPQGHLNLVSIDDVVDAMLYIQRSGTYYLTNPSPPTLEQLFEWIGEYIKTNLRFLPSFKPTPLEYQFQKMAKPFAPYLDGDSFPSHLSHHTPIDQFFIERTLKRNLTP